MRTLRRLAAVSTFALIQTSAFASELTIVQKTTAPGGGSNTTTTYYGTGAFRSSSPDSDTTFDYASGTLIVTEHPKKQYWEATAEDMKAAFGAMDAKLKEVEKQMARMKGNPRFEKMMSSVPGMGPTGEVKVTRTTETRKIAGYDCTKYLVSLGENMSIEMWATSAIKPPMNAYDARKALAMVNPMMQKFSKIFDEMKKIEGLSLAETTTISFMGKQNVVSSEATEVREGAIPASTFGVPAGYKKVESPLKKLARDVQD